MGPALVAGLRLSPQTQGQAEPLPTSPSAHTKPQERTAPFAASSLRYIPLTPEQQGLTTAATQLCRLASFNEPDNTEENSRQGSGHAAAAVFSPGNATGYTHTRMRMLQQQKAGVAGGVALPCRQGVQVVAVSRACRRPAAGTAAHLVAGAVPTTSRAARATHLRAVVSCDGQSSLNCARPLLPRAPRGARWHGRAPAPLPLVVCVVGTRWDSLPCRLPPAASTRHRVNCTTSTAALGAYMRR